MEIKSKSQWKLDLRCYGEKIDVTELGEETLAEIISDVKVGKIAGTADFFGDPLDWSFVCIIGILDHPVSSMSESAKKSILKALEMKKADGWT